MARAAAMASAPALTETNIPMMIPVRPIKYEARFIIWPARYAKCY